MSTAVRTCPLEVHEEGLRLQLTARELGFAVKSVWNPSPTMDHRSTPHAAPITLTIGVRDSEHTAARYSPPPFAIVLLGEETQALLHVVADAGWHRWNQVEFAVGAEGVTVWIDLQGQSSPREAAAHVRVLIEADELSTARHTLLARGLAQAYPQASVPAKIADWWLRPTHCGWGDQAATCMLLEGAGPECRALAYCIQGLYERWTRRLARADVPVGTIIIDAGWSPAGWWKPHEERWPDLKGFIDRQHQAGRRVLLWLATWLWDGLPAQWCLHAGGHRITSDPTHPAYREHLRQCVQELLSPDGYNADGFKIDQLSFCPDRRQPTGGSRFGWCDTYPPAPERIQLAQGDLWGCELLHQLQHDIYAAGKAVKPDALITSSTVHPYFAGTFDMVRLHDMGLVAPDIFAAMQIRADLARAALPQLPIDADDWVHTDYDLWRRYTAGSGKLGVPCTFYAEHFIQQWQQEPLTRPIPEADLREIGNAWRGYLAGLGQS